MCWVLLEDYMPDFHLVQSHQIHCPPTRHNPIKNPGALCRPISFHFRPGHPMGLSRGASRSNEEARPGRQEAYQEQREQVITQLVANRNILRAEPGQPGSSPPARQQPLPAPGSEGRQDSHSADIITTTITTIITTTTTP